MFDTKYVCALSGVRAGEDEIEDGIADGWISITVNRQFVNPKWDAIQSVKEGLVQQSLATVPEEERSEQIVNIVIQVEAQFALLESQTSQFTSEEKMVYIAPPEGSPELLAEYNQIAAALGLELLEAEEEEADEEEAEESGHPEPAEEMPPQPVEAASK
jgi:hypothetical protein